MDFFFFVSVTQNPEFEYLKLGKEKEKRQKEKRQKES